MKVKFKGYMLEKTIEAFMELSNKELPIDVSWDVLDITDKIEKEFEKFRKLNEGIFNKYGEEVEHNGQKLKQIPADNKEALEKIKELNEKDISVDINKLDKESLKGITLSTIHLRLLKPFIK